MHRSEIIRFRCCKSCAESGQASEKCRDPHAKLSLSHPQRCNEPAKAQRPLLPAPSSGRHWGEITPQHQTQEKSELLIPNFLNPYEARCAAWLEARSRDFTFPKQPASCLPSPQAALSYQCISFPDFHQPLQDSCQVRIIRLHRPYWGNSWIRLLGRRRRWWLSCRNCLCPTDAAGREQCGEPGRTGSCSPTSPAIRSLQSAEISRMACEPLHPG